jgi:transposase-like protein
MTMVVAMERKARAVELALRGLSYDRIAEELGYTNRGTAHRTVARALQERIVQGVEALRDAEIARLDHLQDSIWEQAMLGDISAVNTAIRIIDKRIRLLGLDRLDTSPDAPRSLVMPNVNT